MGRAGGGSPAAPAAPRSPVAAAGGASAHARGPVCNPGLGLWGPRGSDPVGVGSLRCLFFTASEPRARGEVGSSCACLCLEQRDPAVPLPRAGAGAPVVILMAHGYNVLLASAAD